MRLNRYRDMVLLRSEELRKWLKITRKNQEWLAYMYRVRPSYISMIMNNRTHISGNFIGFILTLTRMNFDDLFYYDAEKDERSFYGRDIHYRGKVLNSDLYYKVIEKRLVSDQKMLTKEF